MKVIFRNFLLTLRRFKLASVLNVLGLSVAFAAFIVIMMQVRYERTFDTVYKKSGRIYRLESTLIPTGANFKAQQAFTPFCARPLIEMMLPAVPQVESFAIVYGASADMYVTYKTMEGESVGMMMPYRRVTAEFTEIFDPEMVEGTAASLEEPEKVLMPESLARKMFGRESAVGRRITQGDGTFFTIGGVYRDYPENTSIVNDVKIHLEEESKNDWAGLFSVYVVLAPEASPEEAAGYVEDAFEKTGIAKQMGFTERTSFRFNLIEDIYYLQDMGMDITPKGNRMTTHILLAIALLVVGIAAVNFLNFSTALTPARIKSINIQKVLGVSTLALRFAIVFEALGICLISYLLALFWVVLFSVAGLSSILLATVSFTGNQDVFLQTLLLAIGVGIAAGIYPAFYMTSFPPAFVLKGTFGMSPAGRKLRVALTGMQFVISIGLIIAASFIWLQNSYVHDIEGTLNSNRIATVGLDNDMISKHRDVLIEKLKAAPSVEDVGFSAWPVGFLDYYPYTYSQSPAGEDMMYHYLSVSYNFTDLMQLEITGGRGFEKNDETAGEERLIINELAARKFNLKPGDRLGNGSVVLGIVKDFHFMPLRKKIAPMALTLKPLQGDILYPTFYIRTVGSAYRAVDQIKAGIAAVDPLYPADIKFYDRQFEEAYEKERKTSAQITLFGLLSVIISLMGVFGLVTFETQYRRKEISIRKVMGASTLGILLQLNRRFASVTAISFVLAAPISWYGIDQWLQSFAYRVPLHNWVFTVSMLIVLLMTHVTVILQSWRVATANPVEAMKSE